MNYERMMLELLNRIQALEDQVAELMNNQNRINEKGEDKMTTADIRNYIEQLKENARMAGRQTLVLRSGNIHKDLGLKNAMPPVCNAMRQCMSANDIVLHTTPKGNSSTIMIEYKL